MTPAEFRDLIDHNTDAQLLDVCLHDEQTPYVFEAKIAAWNAFRDELGNQLGGVPRTDIRVIGSGRFGFSMSTWSNLRKFDDRSDIDVVIVNSPLFDELWLALLGAAYPRYPLIEKLGGWLDERRNELYTGYLTPSAGKLDIRIVGSKAKPVLEFTSRWFNALKRAGRYPTRRHSDIQGRLYRTWQHADLYHQSSLGALRRTLGKEGVES
jgi:hypothetical protein